MSFVRPAVTERWDRGHWDVAHWDGQIGLSPPAATVVITANTVNLRRALRLGATTASVVITPIDVTLHIAAPQFIHAATASIVVTAPDAGPMQVRRLAVDTAQILVTPRDAGLIAARVLTADSADIIVSGWVNGLNIYHQPGFMEFGWQKVSLRRW